MKRLLKYLTPYRRIVAASLALLTVDSLLQSIGPLITKLAVDRYLVPSKHGVALFPSLTGWLSNSALTGLTQLAMVYFAVVVLGFVFDFGQTYLMQWTGQRAMLASFWSLAAASSCWCSLGAILRPITVSVSNTFWPVSEPS